MAPNVHLPNGNWYSLSSRIQKCPRREGVDPARLVRSARAEGGWTRREQLALLGFGGGSGATGHSTAAFDPTDQSDQSDQ